MSLTVGKLKLVLERLLRVKAAQQALLLVPPADSGAQVCMRWRRWGQGQRCPCPLCPAILMLCFPRWDRCLVVVKLLVVGPPCGC